MPTVSIVTATYNRSNVLRCAVESVLRQRFTDWELIVVGDACTDDTADVLASFRDGRIRFVNLDRNHGEQSVPNNVGGTLATGRLLAYLNHDDLWFSDHLETLVDALDAGGADLAYAMSARIDASGRAHLWGDAPDGVYEFWHRVPASVWMLRRDLLQRVGPWCSADDLWDSPSQDWLRRARACGASIRPVARLTAVQITSGGRQNSYRDRHEAEQAQAAGSMVEDEPRFREHLLTQIALTSSGMQTYVRPLSRSWLAMESWFARACVALGVPPISVANALRYGRKGGFIGHLRRHRGLRPTLGDPR